MDATQVFRLCHVCQCLNEGDNEILRCAHCGKGFLPMHYFERLKLRAHAAQQPKSERSANIAVAEKLLATGIAPVNGLVVIW